MCPGGSWMTCGCSVVPREVWWRLRSGGVVEQVGDGAHINVWSGKEKGPHFTFGASESTVTKLQGKFGCR